MPNSLRFQNTAAILNCLILNDSFKNERQLILIVWRRGPYTLKQPYYNLIIFGTNIHFGDKTQLWKSLHTSLIEIHFFCNSNFVDYSI